MPLTPADVHNVAFKKPPIGKRGYDEDEVDAFLDLIEAEFSRLIEENAELRSSADAGAAEPGGPEERAGEQTPVSSSPAAAAAPGDELGQATRMLALATETADRHVSEAKTKSDKLLKDAQSTSEKLLSEAKSRSETMDRDSRTKAQTITQDAERRRVEIMGSLQERKSALDKEIEGLRTFEREYRTRLKSYLESQLRDLDSRTSAEPSTTAARPGAPGTGNAQPAASATPNG
ncbi:MAG: DivIVA domain-containing protein [Geodermatophilaceae bacterium]